MAARVLCDEQKPQQGGNLSGRADVLSGGGHGAGRNPARGATTQLDEAPASATHAAAHVAGPACPPLHLVQRSTVASVERHLLRCRDRLVSRHRLVDCPSRPTGPAIVRYFS